MIRISITPAAFDAIAAMLASGSVLYERERTSQGGYLVWLDESFVTAIAPDHRDGLTFQFLSGA